jgi:hypothetical protein
MSSRAASATASLRAKQNLIRLLFDTSSSKGTSNGRDVSSGRHGINCFVNNGRSNIESSAHRTTRLDGSLLHQHHHYTYSDLRSAYLKRIQQLHPDKHYNQCNSSIESVSTLLPTTATQTYNMNRVGTNDEAKKCQNQQLFVQVQEAWKVYESFAKVSHQCMKQQQTTSNPNNGTMSNVNTETSRCNFNDDANFTLFGVGCSFSDNEQERQYRNFIMDQASRGYFTVGDIASGNTSSASSISTSTETRMSSSNSNPFNATHGNKDKNTTSKIYHPNQSTMLCDDDFFNHNKETMTATSTTDNKVHRRTGSTSLVSHLIPPHRRRSNKE